MLVHFLCIPLKIGSCQIVVALEVLVFDEGAACFVCLGLVVVGPSGVLKVRRLPMIPEMVVYVSELGLTESGSVGQVNGEFRK